MKTVCLILFFLLLASYGNGEGKDDQWGRSGECVFISKTPSGGTETYLLNYYVDYEANERVRIRIKDSLKERWEVPQTILSSVDIRLNSSFLKPEGKLYKTEFKDDCNFVVRRSDEHNSVLFDASLSFFSEQHLELSTSLDGDEQYIYGLGERVERLRLPYGTYTIWNKDNFNPPRENLYGSHPFFLRRQGSDAYGVLLFNSNGMDVKLEKNRLTYKIIGGIFDFYFFLGPSPRDVLSQYTDVIGKPFLPPLWSLGFHQCRWGYNNISTLENVVDKYVENEIPLDTIWSDIDYMHNYRDFTWDPINYPLDDVKAFHAKLNEIDRHHVCIIDPAIPAIEDYYPLEKSKNPYLEGIDKGIFIRSPENTTMGVLGMVWPLEPVMFPDFTNPGTQGWWKNQIQNFYELGGKLSGIWIDMNEPASFCEGEFPNKCKHPEPHRFNSSNYQLFQMKDLVHYDKPMIYSPPFNLNTVEHSLSEKTVNISTLQYLSRHYNVHNLYGILEQEATYKSLLQLYPNERPFVLSRSTFVGSGKYGGTWGGDNDSSDKSMGQSIAKLITLSMFGISMVGSDICGFGGDTNEMLCARWQALGAFYPFSRNHNGFGSIPQEPYQWDTVKLISQQMLKLRYSFLPYWYTLFFQAHRKGDLVMRPLFVEFPDVNAAWEIDAAFMIGSALYVVPSFQDETLVILPSASGCWFDLLNEELRTEDESCRASLGFRFIPDKSSVSQFLLPSKWNNVKQVLRTLIRGGSIVPMFDFSNDLATSNPVLTTKAAKKQPYKLLIALQSTFQSASGSLITDDGISVSAPISSFIFNASSELKIDPQTHKQTYYYYIHCFPENEHMNNDGEFQNSILRSLMITGINPSVGDHYKSCSSNVSVHVNSEIEGSKYETGYLFESDYIFKVNVSTKWGKGVKIDFAFDICEDNSRDHNKKNGNVMKKVLIGLLIAFILVAILVGGYKFWKNNRNTEVYSSASSAQFTQLSDEL